MNNMNDITITENTRFMDHALEKFVEKFSLIDHDVMDVLGRVDYKIDIPFWECEEGNVIIERDDYKYLNALLHSVLDNKQGMFFRTRKHTNNNPEFIMSGDMKIAYNAATNTVTTVMLVNAGEY